MAATKKKSSASRASGQNSTQKKNKSPEKKRNQKKTEMTTVVPREMWAVIYGVLGAFVSDCCFEARWSCAASHLYDAWAVWWMGHLFYARLLYLVLLRFYLCAGRDRCVCGVQQLLVRRFCLVPSFMRCSVDRIIRTQGLRCSVCWEMVQNCRQGDCLPEVYIVFCAGHFLESGQCCCLSLVSLQILWSSAA